MKRGFINNYDLRAIFQDLEALQSFEGMKQLLARALRRFHLYSILVRMFLF